MGINTGDSETFIRHRHGKKEWKFMRHGVEGMEGMEVDSETATRHVMDSETLVEHRYGQRGKNSGGNVKYGTDT